MNSETVVAVFTNLSQAEAAISDLVASGVPSASIRHFVREEAGTDAAPAETSTTSQHHNGFWAWLTGQENTQGSQDVYDRSIQSGRTVVTVVGDATSIDHIYATLERHDPIDLEDHDGAHAATGAASTQSSYGIGAAAPAAVGTMGSGTTAAGYEAPVGGLRAEPTVAPVATAPALAPRAAGAFDATRTGNTEEVIPLSEETLQVGKREIDRGSTRVRRYTVERPIEEHIRLRDETVSVFRRPVTGTAIVGADAFRDHEIVVTETDEEAVVGKSARVVEEVVVQKGVNERVETIHDTVRREEVEISGPEGRETGTGRVPGSTI